MQSKEHSFSLSFSLSFESLIFMDDIDRTYQRKHGNDGIDNVEALTRSAIVEGTPKRKKQKSSDASHWREKALAYMKYDYFHYGKS